MLFFHCQQWCVILYMFLMLMELSQNKVIQKENESAPMCLFQNIKYEFSWYSTDVRIKSSYEC